MKRLIHFTTALFCIVACTSFTAPHSGVLVRFQNNSQDFFYVLDVNVVGFEHRYENVPPGAVTQWLMLREANDYCMAKVITETDTLVYRPIDDVGKLRTKGKITWLLSVVKGREGKRELKLEKK
jgi:hypothetical protein